MPLKNIAPAFLRRADDDTAFERLYERHVRDVYRYAAAMLGTGADAEDVTQTTFLNAYRAFKKGTRPEKPQSWLITIAHNVCRQRFRQAQRRPREVEFDERVGEGTSDEVTAPTAEDLRRALSQLAPNQRAAIVMRELEGGSYAEIAEMLEISVSALETLLFRARRALREQLEEQLTCQEASFAINKQVDGRLSLAERRSLRAHLRACPECNSLAQSERAQRRALKALVLIPLPATVSHWMGGQSAAAATGAAGGGGLTTVGVTAGGGAAGASSVVFGGVAAKVAAIVVAGAVVGGGSYEGVKRAQNPAARSVQPPTAHVEFASAIATSGNARSANGLTFETPKLVAPTLVLVKPSPRANLHSQGAAHKAHRSPAFPPGQIATAIAHTPVTVRTTPPGLAVKALRSATPASAHSQKSSKQTTQPARTRTRSHPAHPVQSRSKPKAEPRALPDVSRGRQTPTETPPEPPTPKSAP
jgi:RNA polymerase sigma-70 factor (ECF subfamily)